MTALFNRHAIIIVNTSSLIIKYYVCCITWLDRFQAAACFTRTEKSLSFVKSSRGDFFIQPMGDFVHDKDQFIIHKGLVIWHSEWISPSTKAKSKLSFIISLSSEVLMNFEKISLPEPWEICLELNQ